MPISFAFLSRSTEDVTHFTYIRQVVCRLFYSAELIILVSYAVGNHFLMTPSEYCLKDYGESSF
jgi:hypothetical protein